MKKIHKVIHKPDPKNGDRFLLNLELGSDNTNQSFRLSEHVYQKKGNDSLCLPEGINWNNNATVYFILPVKEQGNWVHHFINQLTDASLLTGDTNFHVIIVDFESKDIDMGKAFNTSLLSSRHTIVSLTGKFFKTLALNKAVEQVPNAHDIVFLFDLHIDVPADIMDSARMVCISCICVIHQRTNRPFPSSLVPLFHNESKCETFHMKMSCACSFVFMQIKVIFIRMVSHLDSLLNRGTRELGNGLFKYDNDMYDINCKFWEKRILGKI